MKDMTSEILASVIAHADGQIAKHRTNVLVHCKNSVGVAEHGDHVETIQKEMVITVQRTTPKIRPPNLGDQRLPN